MRVLQIGNFRPEFSTENELHDALLRLPDVVVGCLQEDDAADWGRAIEAISKDEFDLVLWTSTDSYARAIGDRLQYRMQRAARIAQIPVVGYHLDRWFGLEREHLVDERPFFEVDLLITADGGHPEEWEKRSINHVWLPPAISERWCQPGKYQALLDCDVVFVGNGRSYGHTEWRHRREMVEKLREWYGDRFREVPGPDDRKIRGLELNDVYWSAKVVVGDSCLAPKTDGRPMSHYCSDRIPETLGRGGLLFHPSVDGIDEVFGKIWPWKLYDWDDLHAGIELTIEAYDNDDAWMDGNVTQARLANIEFIKNAHTYTHRMAHMLELAKTVTK